jgi:thiamine pyrophosphate-dependent acetolactate synthase large subunit-like protein
MAFVSGNELTAKALKAEGVDTIFYLMGGPINDIILCCQKEGFRTIDVRHEQGTAMMAHAYSLRKDVRSHRAHAEDVEKPEQIRPTLERAFASGRAAVVNVCVDETARSSTARFSFYRM